MELDTKIKCLMAALQLLLHIKTHTHMIISLWVDMSSQPPLPSCYQIKHF